MSDPNRRTLPASPEGLVVAADVETRQDVEDEEKALQSHQKQVDNKPWWKSLGPGLITGAADDDPSGIGTYTVAGAQFGYGLLWLIPVCIPLMIAVQEMCGRVASVCRQGLAGIIKAHYPGWLLWGCVLLLVAANTINVWADLNIIAASLEMMFGLTVWLWLAVTAAATILLQVFVPYRLYVKYLKWLCLALLTYVVTALLPQVHQNWGLIIHSLLVPKWDMHSDFIMTVVAFVGTTISPYLFFWQASETIEEKVADGTMGPHPQREAELDAEIRAIRSDTITGMVASQVVTFFIVICAAATLQGVHIETAQQAARALLPLGKSAYWLFSIGIVGTGLLAIPTLAGSAAYAVAEAAGWRQGLYRRFARARGFYLIIVAVCVLGYGLNFVRSIHPVQALLYAAVINGVVAPPLIVVLLLVCNNRTIMKGRENGWLSNLLGVSCVILMTAGSGVLLWSFFSGHAS